MKVRLLASAIAALAICLPSAAQSATKFIPPEPGNWYRLVTRYEGNDGRRNYCIQYIATGRETADAIYGAPQLSFDEEGYDAQYWRFEENPDTPGQYALINRAAPEGYLSTIPVLDGVPVSEASQLGKDCRWIYVTTPSENPSDRYGFEFMHNDELSGVDDDGNSYAGISTAELLRIADNNLKASIYMNCGGQRVNYAINLWSQDYDEQANEWIFSIVPESPVVPTGIENVISDPAPTSATVHDLLGRPVAHPGHGLYIVSGRIVRL